MGARVEQQAFAKNGLNFVLENYLPDKLTALPAATATHAGTRPHAVDNPPLTGQEIYVDNT